MAEFSSPLTTDQDVFDWEPSLKGSSAITGKIQNLHVAASDEVARAIRVRWWSDRVRNSISMCQKDIYLSTHSDTEINLNSFEPNKLSRPQLLRLAIYCLLGFYIWPMLNTHNEEDTYPLKKSKDWKKRYSEELDKLLEDGILYDWDGDGTPEDIEKLPGRGETTIRIERE